MRAPNDRHAHSPQLPHPLAALVRRSSHTRLQPPQLKFSPAAASLHAAAPPLEVLFRRNSPTCLKPRMPQLSPALLQPSSTAALPKHLQLPCMPQFSSGAALAHRSFPTCRGSPTRLQLSRMLQPSRPPQLSPVLSNPPCICREKRADATVGNAFPTAQQNALAPQPKNGNTPLTRKPGWPPHPGFAVLRGLVGCVLVFRQDRAGFPCLEGEP